MVMIDIKNYGRGLNIWRGFKELKIRYEDILRQYNENTIQTKNEIDRIYNEVVNEIKRIDLLKSVGLKIHINKYAANMKYIGVDFNEDMSLKKESIGRLKLNNKNYNNFFAFLSFNNKNTIQRMLYMTFRLKKIDRKIRSFESKVEDIIYQREIIINNKIEVKEEIVRLRKSIESLLKYISKIERKFEIHKNSILLCEKADETINEDKSKILECKELQLYDSLIEILKDVIQNKYVSWDNYINEGKEIINKIDKLKKEIDELI